MKVEFTETARKELSKLDRPVQLQIKNYLNEVASLEDPKSRGKGLVGNLNRLWRYRVGDYRVICEILDDKILITVLHIAHRKEVYK